MTVQLRHRFGNEDGLLTEWEITTDDANLKLLLRDLPELEGITILGTARTPHNRHWLILPEGISLILAGEMAATLELGDKDLVLDVLQRCHAAFLDARRALE